jgi:hypothetical protein
MRMVISIYCVCISIYPFVGVVSHVSAMPLSRCGCISEHGLYLHLLSCITQYGRIIFGTIRQETSIIVEQKHQKTNLDCRLFGRLYVHGNCGLAFLVETINFSVSYCHGHHQSHSRKLSLAIVGMIMIIIIIIITITYNKKTTRITTYNNIIQLEWNQSSRCHCYRYEQKRYLVFRRV